MRSLLSVFRQLWKGLKCEGGHTSVQGTCVVVIGEIVRSYIWKPWLPPVSKRSRTERHLEPYFHPAGVEFRWTQFTLENGVRVLYLCLRLEGTECPLRFESVLGLKPSRKHLLQTTSTICRAQIRSLQIPPWLLLLEQTGIGRGKEID